MAMHMAAVNVSCYDRLRVLSEFFFDKSFGYLESELGRDVLRVGKAHDIMNSLHCAFPLQRRRAAVLVPCELLIDQPHLIIGLLGICSAVDRGRVQQVLSLVGI